MVNKHFLGENIISGPLAQLSYTEMSVVVKPVIENPNRFMTQELKRI